MKLDVKLSNQNKRINVGFNTNSNLDVKVGPVSYVIDETANTYILEDDFGNEIVGVLVDEETIFDARANDIRLGKVAVTDEGVTEGTKVIPSYHTTEGFKVITPGSMIKLQSSNFEYTKLQALLCLFNTDVTDSVATEKVAINDCVYNVGSTDSLANIVKDTSEEAINFGVTNNSDKTQILRYFYYKEIY